MPPLLYPRPPLSLPRRTLLARCGAGFGLLALDRLLAEEGTGAETSTGGSPHFAPKAKRVIWLFINGGPSQVDTFDYKPELAKRDGEPLAGFDANTGFFAGSVGGLMKSPFAFRQHGESGAWVSEIFPRLAGHVDRMAFVNSCWTDSNNHAPALLRLNTGNTRVGSPALAAG